jgi:hypothetical protein
MSWLFSQALVEEYSADTCSDGALSALLNVMPTPQKFWHNGKTMDVSNLSRFGLTCAVLTADHGEELLTSFLAAFPVKIFVPQVRGPESTARAVDSGQSLSGSFAKLSQDGSTWKIAQLSLLAGLDEFSGTWPRWGSMRSGECWERTTPMLHTKEIGFGFLPTPTASNTKAHHMRGSDKGKVREPRSYGAHGPLNPRFLEWLMGWPMGWTKLEPLAMDRFREWQQQHGNYYPAPKGSS